ncbi:MAG: S6e family ribosomal protein [Candidatus Micrarchaeia archaeon]
MKITYSDAKTGRSTQIEIAQEQSSIFIGKKIGDIIDGSLLGLDGYKFKITGGTDDSGFPLTKRLEGTAKKKVLKLKSKSGREKGTYERITVRGDTISADTNQVNLVITEYGPKSVDEIFSKKEPKSNDNK